jgi:cytochrome c1
MLMPRKVKHRKQQRGRMTGVSKGGNALAFGEYGIQALELDALAPSIAAVSNKLLTEAYGGRYQVEFRTTRIAGKGSKTKMIEDFEIYILDTETGDVIQRPGTPADALPNPYPNEYAARAGNGGALPPDLSVITKAREGGPRYIYSILVGYQTAPVGLDVPAGKYYNPYMPGDLSGFWSGDKKKVPVGGLIAMAPPLVADKVSFDDGTKSTVEQQAKDVVAFLDWAAEPKAQERKQTGFAVLIYLAIFAGLL